MKHFDIIVAGAGVFGVTAAIELRARGYRVALADPGPIPHPLAASTDISKVVRMEYGGDEQYMEMVEASLPIWRDWNDDFNETLFHETGMCILTRRPMRPGGFEYESFERLLRRGHDPERLDAETITRRFPNWQPGAYVDGFYHALGGYAESGRVVTMLAARAKEMGVDLLEGFRIAEVIRKAGKVHGVQSQTGHQVSCDHVLIAAGAWTPFLVPEFAAQTRISGHPVFHLSPPSPESFDAESGFPTFMADVSQTGWYGFPLHPREGVVKIANHGVGFEQHPDAERKVFDLDREALQAFLAHTFPTLQDAPIVYTRRCLYCDTLDGHFWIDHHPQIQGLSIASGGSGHGFKFAPILGALIADAVEQKPNNWLPKFAWRTLSADTTGEEASRHQSS
jgi:glycine/D-amino acid oxidase-like deaminating enzyme